MSTASGTKRNSLPDNVSAQTIRDDLLRCVAEAMVEVGKVEIIHEDRLLQIMELFHEEIDRLDEMLESLEEYQLQRKDILTHLKHKICALFLDLQNAHNRAACRIQYK